MLSMILAIDNDNLVGKVDSQYGLAWHYPEDMKFYKKMTSNKINVMGRKTFEAIGGALPNRETYVLTSNKSQTFPNATTLNSLADVLNLDQDDQEIMIIGGVEVFKLIFDHVKTIYLTKIDNSHLGDVYYPDLNLSKFELVDEFTGEDKRLVFQTWVRR